jgi:hypothetical protein
MSKAQLKPRKVSASTSTHKGNEDDLLTDESGDALNNHMSVDTLIDPEDYNGGATHYSNDEPSHPTFASKKKKVKANENADGDSGGSSLNPGTNNVGTIDNLTDPDEGYIGATDMDDIDPDMDDDVDFDVDDPDASNPAEDEDQFTGTDPDGGETTASDTELQNSMSVSPLEASEEDEDWDAAPAADDEDLEDDLAEEDEESGNGGVAIEDVQDEPEEASTDEDVSILDVDETPDHEVEDVAFATAGTRLLAIKANRIIASMTGRMAIAAGRNDVYLTDQFQEVTAMQIKQLGLRKGLKSMGFALAKVTLAKASVIKAQVQKEVHKTTAAVRKVNAEKEKAFEQSLAIASVGINRNMFKHTENPLKAHLEGEFRRLGIRGAGRILTQAFAEHGPAYAKSVVELAKKISAMPEEVRDSYVDALDMDTGVVDEPEEDVIPIGADMEDGEDDLEDEGFGDTVEAALARPGVRVQASAAANGKYSVTANEILNGKRPLFG